MRAGSPTARALAVLTEHFGDPVTLMRLARAVWPARSAVPLSNHKRASLGQLVAQIERDGAEIETTGTGVRLVGRRRRVA